MLFTRNKPEWLYRALPAVYFLGGLVAVVLSGEPVGRFSGGLLILAAVSIRSMRWHHQRLRDQEALAAFEVPVKSPRKSAVVSAKLAVATPPAVGHTEIDRQHRRLAVQAVRLRAEALQLDPANESDLELELYELLDSLAVHFRTENAELAKVGHTELSARQASMDERLQLAEACLQRYRLGEKSLDTLIARVADQLVLAHIHEQHPNLARPTAGASGGQGVLREPA